MSLSRSHAICRLLLSLGLLAVAGQASAQEAPEDPADQRPYVPRSTDDEEPGEDADGGEPLVAPCDPEGAFHRSTLGFGLGMGIAYLPELDGINHRLARAGVEELPTFAPYLSLAVPASLGRLMALAQLRLTSASAEQDGASFDTLHATLAVGYSLTPPETLALYPFVGLGIGAAELTIGTGGSLVPSFDRALTESSGALELSSLAMLGTAGMGADLLLARVDDHPTRGLFASARVGVTAAFVSTDWSFGSGRGSLPDGPRSPLGGMYAEVGAGLRF